jgi:hypothetical protein
MRAGRIRPLVAKELRALLPIWIASAVAMVAAVMSGPRNHELGLLAYGFGSVTLGAQSIGHEYTCRTLTLLLAQPLSRRRLLLLKLAVLTVMLLTLAAFARLMLLWPGDEAWVFLSMLNGLFLAPLLTMACRAPVAGVVFTGAAPFWILAIGSYVSGGVLWSSALTLFAASAVAAWRLFMRLEASDGRDADLRAPQLFQRAPASDRVSTASASRRHPVWLLVKKELHLQQMTFAAAVVCTGIWIGIGAATWIIPGLHAFPVRAVGILYGALLALLIGSLASAGEREIGTLEWQVLLPMAAWKQWAVKVGTVLALAGVLSFAIPLVLASGLVSVHALHAGVVVFLVSGSLYVSSLCRSGLRALIISGPVMLALSTLAQHFYTAFDRTPFGGPSNAWFAVPFAGAVPLLLWFGLQNHRSTEQSAGQVSRQIVWMAACLGLLYFVP